MLNNVLLPAHHTGAKPSKFVSWATNLSAKHIFLSVIIISIMLADYLHNLNSQSVAKQLTIETDEAKAWTNNIRSCLN